jgi:hypothetical protein
MGISLTGLTPATTYDALIKVGDNGPITSALKVLSDGLGTNLPMEASTTGVNFTGVAQVGGVAIANTTQLATKQDTLVSGTNIKTINSTSLLGSGDIAVVTAPSGVSGAIQFSNGSAFASDATNLFWDDTNNRLGIGTNVPTQTLDVRNAGTGSVFNVENSRGSFIFGFDTLGGYGQPATVGKGVAFYNNAATSFLAISGSGGTGINISNPSAALHIKGSGSTSATTSLLVQNSAGVSALTVKDNLFIEGLSASNQLNFRFGPTNQGIGTRNGDFSIGLSDSTSIIGGRFYNNGTGNFWIDGVTEGASKAQNYPMIFGSRAAATGNSVGSYTTEENGSQSYFGFYVAQPSAQVVINSTTRGFLPPRMTTTQKNAIASPAAGLVVYDSTTNKLCCYDGSTWNDLF